MNCGMTPARGGEAGAERTVAGRAHPRRRRNAARAARGERRTVEDGALVRQRLARLAHALLARAQRAEVLGLGGSAKRKRGGVAGGARERRQRKVLPAPRYAPSSGRRPNTAQRRSCPRACRQWQCRRRPAGGGGGGAAAAVRREMAALGTERPRPTRTTRNRASAGGNRHAKQQEETTQVLRDETHLRARHLLLLHDDCALHHFFSDCANLPPSADSRVATPPQPEPRRRRTLAARMTASAMPGSEAHRRARFTERGAGCHLESYISQDPFLPRLRRWPQLPV